MSIYFFNLVQSKAHCPAVQSVMLSWPNCVLDVTVISVFSPYSPINAKKDISRNVKLLL